MVARKKKPKRGTRFGGGKRRLPGLARVQTITPNRAKKLPAKPANPVVDDEEFSFDRAPSTLNVEGAKLWRSTVKILRIVGELHSKDYFGLKTLCYHYQRICKRERAEQDIPTNERNTFNRLLIEYGMTPAAGMRIDPHGKLRKNGPPSSDPRAAKVFEEQNMPVEGEEKDRNTKIGNLEDRAATLL